MPFEIVRNDITRMRVDAIVNAANNSLLGGGGVDGAIHAAAGPELLAECRGLNGCATGEAKITKGYRLPAKYVIHTVGPVWQGGRSGEEELLKACYRNSLKLALEHGCESVAFPMISSGAYGYPADGVMAAAVEEISRFLLDHEMTVYLVVFGQTSFLAGKKLFREVQEYIDDAYAESRTENQAERRRRAGMIHPLKRLRDRREEEITPPGSLEETGPADMDAAPMASARPGRADGEAAPESTVFGTAGAAPDWEQILKRTDEGFSQALLRMIDERGITDAQCYKKANVDRKLFSKIRTNPEYKPSKPTVFAFCVSLELSLGESRELLKKAGYAFTRSSKMDLVMEYFITHRHYNIYEINEVLFQFDLPLLGSAAV